MATCVTTLIEIKTVFGRVSLLISRGKGRLAELLRDGLNGCASVRQASALRCHPCRGDPHAGRVLELGLVNPARRGPRLIGARPPGEDRTSARAARAGHDGERR